MRKKQRLMHIKVREGRFQLEGVGSWYSYWRDPYHLMLVIPWPGFLAVISVLYIAINLLFGVLYFFNLEGIANARTDNFFDAYFFSVQTLGSIGYGAMYPRSFYINTIVSLEAMVGMVSIALLTGIAFARFSRSTARIMFSKNAVICPQNGVPTLMLRAANERGNEILEARVRVHLLRDEITQEGEHIRRIYDLPLIRDQSHSFRLSWTIFHPITESSPLSRSTYSDLQRQQVTLIVTIHGLDETVGQTVHARKDYTLGEILWGYRLSDMIQLLPSGDRVIDYSRFHETEAIAAESPH